MQPYRSVLFLPGHKPRWAAKAVASGADAVVIDLEDSVPYDLKAEARQAAAQTITELRADGVTAGLFVRPNALDTGLAGADLDAAVVPGLTGLFIPKVRSRDDIIRWEALTDCFEVRNGVSALEFIVPVEMVEAIQRASQIAGASPRVGAMIGPTAEHADIARAVGYKWTPEGLESLYLRSRVLLACREHRIHALTGLWEDLENLDGLRIFAEQGLQLGFRGQIAIHPSHVATINDVFSPTAEEIAFRKDLIAAFEEAAARGDGAARYRGIHIDKAHADTAREWLEHVSRITAVTATTN